MFSDIRNNHKITSNNEKCRHLLHTTGSWKAEARLNHSKISATSLIFQQAYFLHGPKVDHYQHYQYITRYLNFGYVARLPDRHSAHQALVHHVELSVGRPPDLTWKRQPGHTCANGCLINQIPPTFSSDISAFTLAQLVLNLANPDGSKAELA